MNAALLRRSSVLAITALAMAYISSRMRADEAQLEHLLHEQEDALERLRVVDASRAHEDASRSTGAAVPSAAVNSQSLSSAPASTGSASTAPRPPARSVPVTLW